IKKISLRVRNNGNSATTRNTVWFDNAQIKKTNITSEIIEENNYYAFGMKHEGYNNITTATDPALKYKYNGKELQDEMGLDWYDYQARNYDPTLGRWFNIDPLAEKSRRFSPYTYALDNPVFFIDPDGMLATPPDWFVNNENGQMVYFKGKSEVTQDMLDKVGYKGDANSFERIGDDKMFGDELKTKEGVDVLEKDYVALSNSKTFMESRNYGEAEKVTIKETEHVSGGPMGQERVSSTITDLEQIGETRLSYAKKNELVTDYKQLDKNDIISQTSSSSRWSSSRSITYNLTKPKGQKNEMTAQYYGNRDSGNTGNVINILRIIVEAF
ncbi:RHS repeat-associated core domain-containing protein, partial [Flavobacterium sp. LaA7.5]|nr:RHS repeat-associated core domain-containing protein [Flavobacterium salilacus subsp. altitudinum]